ncbi:Hypothetical protein HDN1F_13560 [gamma proteobacterium HdN1]|nr:Hypothetical protein HDN1F_13560 [gamma proteobacterium HdN1]
MSTELIAAFVVLGAVVLAGMFYVNRNMEKEKAKKGAMIGQLSEVSHRLLRIVEAVPDAYIHKEFKRVILGEVQKRLEKLVELAPTQDTYKKKLDSTIAMLADCNNAAAEPSPPTFSTPQEGNEIRALLQELLKIIDSFEESGIIPNNAGNAFRAHIHDAFAEATVSQLILIAEQNKVARKWKLAVYHYQKASGELTKRNHNGRYAQRISQLNALCDELNRLADEESGTIRKSPDASELTKGVDDLNNEDDAWKKKYF